ncbi:dehydrogenase molybdenum cofactor insertion protein [Syntrophotalea carbinolica DSM 2380]|uniref:Dehydrogenase molybdenum cofactor insertion protein n=1 Tax=Syntrophotalea carbinolica (strain DSM 2380 / NBRC 103641 / GraBd1) TaxID=338963 RepID=Q3A804_SYNC1|nr:dehydrogenase molybdenum cofactor insertion protein [Syntrophotalea carbinolica DSM 2380]
MPTLKQLVKSLCGFLDAGEDLAVATILTRSGSAPRTAGTKMIIRANGEICGTIGGGLVEARAQATAPEIFATHQSRTFVFDMTGDDADSMDMICGGEVEILLEYVPACEENRIVFDAWQEALQTGRKCLLVTPLPTENPQSPLQRCLLHADSTCFGPVPLPEEIRKGLLEATRNCRYPTLLQVAGGQFFVEPSFVPATLFLFGAGHVCQPTAALATMVGFNTVVFDDRAEFANRQRFPRADEIVVVPSYEDCMANLDIDSHSYLVIVSRGHRHDQSLLRQAVQTDAGYIGMIGSRGKRDKIYHNLEAEGISRETLDKVYSPIGTAIDAETPQEIAVSIVGELIKVRAALQRNHD